MAFESNTLTALLASKGRRIQSPWRIPLGPWFEGQLDGRLLDASAQVAGAAGKLFKAPWWPLEFLFGRPTEASGPSWLLGGGWRLLEASWSPMRGPWGFLESS